MQFFPSSGRVDIAICMHYIDAKRMEKKLDGNYTRILRAIKQVLEAAPHKAAAARPPTTHHESYPSCTGQTCVTHSWRSTDDLISDILLQTPSH